ncbi:methyltransferase domain-containing protein [Flavobacterium sp. W22_SRS_FP1]|uniref:methyltransferase domain-containing protein n=1 Tax=Flavobacterium sp. W22_SRS_FP1 TaxID=3240276 RepID=UPI003F8F911B
MGMYNNEAIFERSWDKNYLSEELIQAQWAEFVELKKCIADLYQKNKAPLKILDIGIGNARIAKHLSGINEIWDMVGSYDGTDNAEACVELSRQTAQELEIDDKVKVYLVDAIHLDTWKQKYDLILITWFTAGNFYPINFSFDSYHSSGNRLDLYRNEQFETIFSNLYALLNPGGEIVIGACYLDNDATRLKQEHSYKKMGMTVITTNEDSFTATKEGFWSQRFNKEKIQAYLHFVTPEKISFTALDTYNYAMQVRIQK